MYGRTHANSHARCARAHMCLKFDLNSYNNSTKLPYSNVCKFCIRKGHTKHKSNLFSMCAYACVCACMCSVVRSFVWSQTHKHACTIFMNSCIQRFEQIYLEISTYYLHICQQLATMSSFAFKCMLFGSAIMFENQIKA